MWYVHVGGSLPGLATLLIRVMRWAPSMQISAHLRLWGRGITNGIYLGRKYFLHSFLKSFVGSSISVAWWIQCITASRFLWRQLQLDITKCITSQALHCILRLLRRRKLSFVFLAKRTFWLLGCLYHWNYAILTIWSFFFNRRLLFYMFYWIFFGI